LASEPIANPNPPTDTPQARACQSSAKDANKMVAGTLEMNCDTTTDAVITPPGSASSQATSTSV